LSEGEQQLLMVLGLMRFTKSHQSLVLLDEPDTHLKRLALAGFSKAFSDPYYAAFVRAWGRKYAETMAGQQFVSPEKQQQIDQIATEVLKEAIAEVEKGTQG
jgi:hypothetical protein